MSLKQQLTVASLPLVCLVSLSGCASGEEGNGSRTGAAGASGAGAGAPGAGGSAASGGALGGVGGHAGDSGAQTVPVGGAAPDGRLLASYVDTSRERFDRLVLMVGQEPFLFRGAQVRADTMKKTLGWSDDEIAPLFAHMARDGFTTANVILFWSDIEKDKDVFDWSVLDTHLGWCEDNGLKLEIIWFGSDSTSYSFGNGPNMDRVPDYVKTDYTFVTRADGTEVVTPTWNRKLLDKTDPSLLERESLVVKTMMNHVAVWNRERGNRQTLIGIQLLNEPYTSAVRDGARTRENLDRSYSVYSTELWESGGYTDAAQFRRDVLQRYLTGLARAVKESDYVVWTRANVMGDALPVAENEAMRASGTHYLDFYGYDPYTHDINYLYNYGTDPFWAQGANYPMVMENYAGGGDVAREILSTFSGGAVINHYSALESESSSDTTGYPGVYDKDQSTRSIREWDITVAHRSVNELLGKAWYDIATRATQASNGKSLAFFNNGGAAQYDKVRLVGGLSVRYATANGGTGIAIARSEEEYVLLAYGTGRFEIAQAELAIGSATLGHFDGSNTWIEEAPKAYGSANGQHVIEMNPQECVRIIRNPS
jgi:hypothetical protein